MLWTKKYAPKSVNDIIQEDTRELLKRVRNERLNAIFHGPKGVGKSAAVLAIAEDIDAAVSVINIRDIFSSTRKELSEDPRYSRFSGSNKRETAVNALKESTASMGEKIVLIDNAEKARRDFQEALRRTVEKTDTQFILTTRSLSVLIPAIRSRFFPVRFGNPSREETVDLLANICESEDIEYNTEALEYVIDASSNLRESILLLQSVSFEGKVDEQEVFKILEETEEDEIKNIIELSQEGKIKEAIEKVDEIENPVRILDHMSSYGDAKLAEMAGEAEEEVVESLDENITIKHMISKFFNES